MVAVLVAFSAVAWTQRSYQSSKDQLTRASLGPELFRSYKELITSPAYSRNFPDLWYGLIHGWRAPTRYEVVIGIRIAIQDDKDAVRRVRDGKSNPTAEMFEVRQMMAPVLIDMSNNVAKEWGELTGGMSCQYLVDEIGENQRDFTTLLHNTKSQGDHLSAELMADLEQLNQSSFSNATIPQGDPIYETLKQLRREGLLFTPGLKNRVNPSKFQIAQWLRESYRSINTSLLSLDNADNPDRAHDLIRWSANSAAFEKSIRYFAPELSSLKDDPHSIIEDIHKWPSEAAKRLGNYDVSQTIPDIRKLERTKTDEQAMADLKTLRQTGMDRNLNMSMHVRPTNYMVAACLEPTILHMKDTLKKLASPDCPVIDCSMVAVEIGMSVDSLQRLIKHFEPELRATKIDPDRLRREIRGARDLVGESWTPQKVAQWNLFP